MSNISNQLSLYKRRQHLKCKYRDELEFDKIKRSNSRIVRFCKKRYLRNPVNITDKEINDIPPKYRYRIKISAINQYTPDVINEITNNYNDDAIKNLLTNDIQFSNDDNLNKSLLESMNVYTCKKYLDDLDPTFASFCILIDLRIYAELDDIPVCHLDNLYYFTKQQQNEIKKRYNLVNETTEIGLRFQKVLNYAKALSQTYMA
jgi:hypothetical protein